MGSDSPTRDEWYHWSERQLLFYGTALLLAGTIFFFAYNWVEMGKFLKFGLIEAVMITTIAGAWRIGVERPAGKMLITTAAVLVGVLLAVYGQTYQTGADPYGLFLTWALLITGWAWLARSPALWLIWLLLLNLSLILFEAQVLSWSQNRLGAWTPLALALLNGTALAIFEWRIRLNAGWLRLVLLTVTLLPLLAVTMKWIFTYDYGYRFYRLEDATHLLQLALPLQALSWLLATVALFLFYRFRRPHMPSLALVTLNTIIVLLSDIGRLLYASTHGFDYLLVNLFLFIIITVIVVGSAVALLQRIHQALQTKVPAQ